MAPAAPCTAPEASPTLLSRTCVFIANNFWHVATRHLDEKEPFFFFHLRRAAIYICDTYEDRCGHRSRSQAFTCAGHDFSEGRKHIRTTRRGRGKGSSVRRLCLARLSATRGLDRADPRWPSSPSFLRPCEARLPPAPGLPSEHLCQAPRGHKDGIRCSAESPEIHWLLEKMAFKHI